MRNPQYHRSTYGHAFLPSFPLLAEDPFRTVDKNFHITSNPKGRNACQATQHRPLGKDPAPGCPPRAGPTVTLTAQSTGLSWRGAIAQRDAQDPDQEASNKGGRCTYISKEPWSTCVPRPGLTVSITSVVYSEAGPWVDGQGPSPKGR